MLNLATRFFSFAITMVIVSSTPVHACNHKLSKFKLSKSHVDLCQNNIKNDHTNYAKNNITSKLKPNIIELHKKERTIRITAQNLKQVQPNLNNNNELKDSFPKNIFLYWDQGIEKTPNLAKDMQKLWIALNPDWKVVVLDQKSYKNWVSKRTVRLLESDPFKNIPSYERDNSRLRANIIRTALLKENGGVWADFDIMPLVPLSDFLFDNNGALANGGFDSGLFWPDYKEELQKRKEENLVKPFKSGTGKRPLENWFLASEKNGHVITKFSDAAHDFVESGFVSELTSSVHYWHMYQLDNLILNDEKIYNWYLKAFEKSNKSKSVMNIRHLRIDAETIDREKIQVLGNIQKMAWKHGREKVFYEEYLCKSTELQKHFSKHNVDFYCNKYYPSLIYQTLKEFFGK